jgi:hypothetical protein
MIAFGELRVGVNAGTRPVVRVVRGTTALKWTAAPQNERVIGIKVAAF